MTVGRGQVIEDRLQVTGDRERGKGNKKTDYYDRKNDIYVLLFHKIQLQIRSLSPVSCPLTFGADIDR
jgi:hypothetical protein